MIDKLASRRQLRFESGDRLLGLTAPCEPYEGLVGQWRLCEMLDPHPDNELREKGVGVYRMSMERQVSTQTEVWIGLQEACKLADEIDVAWCYAWGKPYYTVISALTSCEAPSGWSGNLRQVEQQIQRDMRVGYVAASQVVQHRWAWWPCLPFERVLAVRHAIATAPTILRDLVELHIGSHKSVDGALFCLAKAIEVVGAFFAGQQGKGSRAARNAGIEAAMRKIGVDSEMTQTVSWLFDIANERFDVRHAWNKVLPGVVLHPRMTDEERRDFVCNANLVIRAFVCDRLGLDVSLITMKEGEPSKAGRWKGNTLVFED